MKKRRTLVGFVTTNTTNYFYGSEFSLLLAFFDGFLLLASAFFSFSHSQPPTERYNFFNLIKENVCDIKLAPFLY